MTKYQASGAETQDRSPSLTRSSNNIGHVSLRKNYELNATTKEFYKLKSLA